MNFKYNCVCMSYYSSRVRIHTLLREQNGKATFCENPSCKKTSNRYEWALKRGKTYTLNIKNYLQLCRTCHIQYDKVTFRNTKFLDRELVSNLRFKFSTI